MAPLIVQELRRENAKLRHEVARLKRQEAFFAAVARKRVAHLESGLRSVADRGYAKRVRRILSAPMMIPSRAEIDCFEKGDR